MALFLFPFSFLCVIQIAIMLSTFTLLKWPNPFLPLHTYKINIIFLLWDSGFKWYFGSIFPKILGFRARRSYQRYTCSWLEDSASWPETVNHQQYPDGLWLGLVMMHILGEFPGFVHDSFSFDFPSWKGKISQNIVIVCTTEHFTRSFAPIEWEILRWLLHGDVVVLYHGVGSVSVFLFCCVQAQAHRNLL